MCDGGCYRKLSTKVVQVREDIEKVYLRLDCLARYAIHQSMYFEAVADRLELMERYMKRESSSVSVQFPDTCLVDTWTEGSVSTSYLPKRAAGDPVPVTDCHRRIKLGNQLRR
ncbi:unnamed protein product [Calicophoron daubneyi]|uniref:Uncharacterized protein n=1 Tax=Calicophoron daubneyi TaxID=300641 RepID=A0AAV2TXJ2_CALDB